MYNCCWRTCFAEGIDQTQPALSFQIVLACCRYIPILPMVLVNGAEGIGTGWSTSIPNYSPRAIVANLQRLLQGQEVEPMNPWYQGFKGSIEEIPSKTSGKSYAVNGIINQVNSVVLKLSLYANMHPCRPVKHAQDMCRCVGWGLETLRAPQSGQQYLHEGCRRE